MKAGISFFVVASLSLKFSQPIFFPDTMQDPEAGVLGVHSGPAPAHAVPVSLSGRVSVTIPDLLMAENHVRGTERSSSCATSNPVQTRRE